MLGGVVSTTVSTALQELVLPDPSLAVYVTVVVPSGNEPAPGPLTVTPGQLSLAVAAGGVTNALRLPVHSAVVAAGQVIVGAVVSTTVTVPVQLDDAPWLSVTTSVAVVGPSPNDVGLWDN